MAVKKEERCTARQVNRRSADFECKLTVAHTVHVDPRTGMRWGMGSKPAGMRRKNRGAYSNRKLHRQSAVAAAAAGKPTGRANKVKK